MSRSLGEMEFEFEEKTNTFVATEKVVQFLRGHLARGEAAEAARLYEDNGASCAPQLLAELGSASSVTQRSLAEMFVLARDFKSAAVVFEKARVLDRAAQLYEQALDFDNAGRCFEATGDLARAAGCYERAGQPGRAIEIHHRVGPTLAAAECLARQGLFVEAASVYRHLLNVKAEIDMLRLVPMHSEHRLPAVARLVELLETYQQHEQAIGLLLETLRAGPPPDYAQPMLAKLAQLLEQTGRYAEAAQVRARSGQGAPALAAPGQGMGAAMLPAAQMVPVTSSPQRTMSTSGAFAVPMRPVPQPAMAPAPVIAQKPVTSSRDPFGSFVDPFSGAGTKSATTPKPVPVMQQAPHNNDAYAHLKSIPIFAELAVQDMRELYRICAEEHLRDGEVLVEQGQPGNGLHVIVQGTVRVVRMDAHGGTELAQLGPGSYVGELSLLDAAPTSARVFAMGPVGALRISPERFQQFVLSHDAAATRIFHLFARTLAERLRNANQRR